MGRWGLWALESSFWRLPEAPTSSEEDCLKAAVAFDRPRALKKRPEIPVEFFLDLDKRCSRGLLRTR